MLNLGSLQSLRQAHREANLLQIDEMARIGLATRFNQEIAAVQRRVTMTLEQAATGNLDEGEVTGCIPRWLTALPGWPKTCRRCKPRLVRAGRTRRSWPSFEAYRNFIISATDLAAIDPRGGMRHAYQAASSYVALSEHTHAIAAAVSTAAATRGESQARLFEQHAVRIAVIGGVLVALLMVGWFAFVAWTARRLSGITSALQSLADGNVDPPSMPLVEAIGARIRAACCAAWPRRCSPFAAPPGRVRPRRGRCASSRWWSSKRPPRWSLPI
jgi:two-component system sensor histidine kinase/response regulator